jgi:hypothetical protein
MLGSQDHTVMFEHSHVMVTDMFMYVVTLNHCHSTYVRAPISTDSLSAGSVTCSLPWPSNKKWKITEMFHTFQNMHEARTGRNMVKFSSPNHLIFLCPHTQSKSQNPLPSYIRERESTKCAMQCTVQCW